MSEPSSPSILRSAGVMGVATFLSRISGLVREQVFAVLFGAGNATDAFNVAFRIPNLLRDLFAEGAMSASLVPTFTRARTEEGERRAWRVAGLVFRVLFVTVGILAVAGIVFAPQLVGLYASAFQAIPGKFELTVEMTRIMFPFFPLVALAAAFMGILNACGYFFLPAFASALFNVASIVVGGGLSLVLFKHGAKWGIQPIEGMAIGVLVGGIIQAFSQLPTLYKVGYRWEPKQSQDPPWHQDPALRRMLWMMIPGTIGLAATQINILVNTILATTQGSGAVSRLNFAFRLMQFPIGVFGVSLAAATLPRISQQWVNQDFQSVRGTLQNSLRQVFAVNLPASAGLAFLGYPIIELIFQYGRFYPEDTQATAQALAMYSIGLTAYSAVKVLVPAFYAMGNTRIPVISSVVSVLLTIVLNILMVKPFGFWGLALGTSLAALMNAAFLLGATRRLLGEKSVDFPILPLLRTFVEYTLLALAMGWICMTSHRFLNSWMPDQVWLELLGVSGIVVGRAFKVTIIVMEGALFAAIVARWFKLTDLTEVFDFFTSKLKKKLRPKPT